MLKHQPPFLRRIEQRDKRPGYPYDVGLFQSGQFKLEFTRPVTCIVGDNGSGKSTLLEAIAAHCGFAEMGGTQNFHRATPDWSEGFLRFSWSIKRRQGFYCRAEAFYAFATHLEEMAKDQNIGPIMYVPYGGKSLHDRSHGEAFLTTLSHRLPAGGLFLLDEPEAALAPERLLQLMHLFKRAEAAQNAQLIIVTHNPLLMAYPGADLRLIVKNALYPVALHEIPHFKLMQQFYADPVGFIETEFWTDGGLVP